MPSSKRPGSSPDDAVAGTGGAGSRAWHSVLLVLALVILGFLFAKVEIQVEGAAGWAANLPTWRVESHPLLDLFWGGKALTGYHLWVFIFMAAVFHLPLVMMRTFTLELECRALGSVMIFWILEDFLWFVLNPAFGVGRLTPQFVPWHKHWLLGLPTDYWVFCAAGSLLIAYSFRRSRSSQCDYGLQPPATLRRG